MKRTITYFDQENQEALMQRYWRGHVDNLPPGVIAEMVSDAEKEAEEEEIEEEIEEYGEPEYGINVPCNCFYMCEACEKNCVLACGMEDEPDPPTECPHGFNPQWEVFKVKTEGEDELDS